MIKRLSTNYIDLNETAKEIARQQVHNIDGDSFINDRINTLFHNVYVNLEKAIGINNIKTEYNGQLQFSVNNDSIPLGTVEGLYATIEEEIINKCLTEVDNSSFGENLENTNKYKVANTLENCCEHIFNHTNYILNANYTYSDKSNLQEISVEIDDYNFDFDYLEKKLGDDNTTEEKLVIIENVLNSVKETLKEELRNRIEEKFNEMIEEFENDIEQMYNDAESYVDEQLVDYDFDEEGNIQ